MTGVNRRTGNLRASHAPIAGQRSISMVVTSIGRIVAPSLAIVAASGAALFFGITHLRGEPPVEIKATITAAAALPPASGDKDRGAAGPAAAPAEVNAAAAVLGVLPSSPGTDQPVPAFDVARIDQTGEAVIAGEGCAGRGRGIVAQR